MSTSKQLAKKSNEQTPLMQTPPPLLNTNIDNLRYGSNLADNSNSQENSLRSVPRSAPTPSSALQQSITQATQFPFPSDEFQEDSFADDATAQASTNNENKSNYSSLLKGMGSDSEVKENNLIRSTREPETKEIKLAQAPGEPKAKSYTAEDIITKGSEKFIRLESIQKILEEKSKNPLIAPTKVNPLQAPAEKIKELEHDSKQTQTMKMTKEGVLLPLEQYLETEKMKKFFSTLYVDSKQTQIMLKGEDGTLRSLKERLKEEALIWQSSTCFSCECLQTTLLSFANKTQLPLLILAFVALTLGGAGPLTPYIFGALSTTGGMATVGNMIKAYRSSNRSEKINDALSAISQFLVAIGAGQATANLLSEINLIPKLTVAVGGLFTGAETAGLIRNIREGNLQGIVMNFITILGVIGGVVLEQECGLSVPAPEQQAALGGTAMAHTLSLLFSSAKEGVKATQNSDESTELEEFARLQMQ